MSFAVFNVYICVCSGESVLVYNLETKTENIIILPKVKYDKHIISDNKDYIESFNTLTSVIYSNDGKYFLICTNRKQICLYKNYTFELVANRILPRAASKVRFLLNNDVLVADKCGDAYVFSTSKPNENGQLLLGHLSMLLDILVTDDEKYIITADRDEKIRISMFPNSYNILSYCLGHTNFVTNVALIPHDKNILVSSGGDGSLMFWNFQNGEKLLATYYHEKLSQDDLLSLNVTLKENELEEYVTVSPVKHLKTMLINNDKSILLLSFYCSSTILIYSVSKQKNSLNVEYLESVTVEKEPLECQCYNDQLWILTDSRIQIYKFNGINFVVDEKLDSEIKILNESWKNLHSVPIKTLLPVLYKRKFDNIQEYQERKRTRLIK